jgi:hypothetical protein
MDVVVINSGIIKAHLLIVVYHAKIFKQIVLNVMWLHALTALYILNRFLLMVNVTLVIVHIFMKLAQNHVNYVGILTLNVYNAKTPHIVINVLKDIHF